MKQISKHSFEAVSLLTTNNGMLDVTIIPAFNQPDWIIPNSLILHVDDCQGYAATHAWQQQTVPIFHLFPQDQTPDKVVILEGNTVEQRFALQTVGALHELQARISEVKDTDILAPSEQTTVDEQYVLSYLFQTVSIDQTDYLVPDLDKIAHHLMNIHN